MYYCYLSDGTKLSLGSSTSTLTQRYRGSLVYNNGQFESASFGSGRIVGTDNGSEVHYFLTDHLGSTRVVAKVTPTGREDLDRKDYYPFGKEWRQPDMPASDNRYMFSGKERSDICLENDYSSILPIYDFGARSYYPEGVFFLQQDPLMEKYYSIGQYAYCAGNPISRIDPDGKDWVRGIDGNNYLWMDNVTKNTETPDGYVYVGSNNNDILTDLGISNSYRGEEKLTAIGFADESSALNTPNISTRAEGVATVITAVDRSKVEGNVTITPNISYGESSPNNNMGATFDGITISGNYAQSSQAGNLQDGKIVVTNNGNEQETMMYNNSTNSIRASNSKVLSGSTTIPAKELSPGSISKIQIKAGNPDPTKMYITAVVINLK